MGNDETDGWQELLRRVTHRVVAAAQERGESIGSAVALSPRHLLTARHVVADAAGAVANEVEARGVDRAVRRFTVRSHSSGAREHQVTVLELCDGPELDHTALRGSMPRLDAGLRGFGFQAGRFGQGGVPFALRALGLSRETSDGRALLRAEGTPIGGGVSGSPVLNLDTGEVCGVVVTSAPHRGTCHVRLLDAHELQLLDIPEEAQVPPDEWMSQLTDSQIRESGRRYLTREVRRFVQNMAESADTHPLGSMWDDANVPDLTVLYQPQSLRLSVVSGEDAGAEVADLGEVLETSRNAVVIAGPGGGKSTALLMARQRAAVSSAMPNVAPDGLYPIALSAGDVAPGQPVDAMVRAACLRVPMMTNRAWSDDFFRRSPVPGSVWTLLVDGLDEIIDPVRRRDVVNALRAVATDPDLPYRVVVTTRPLPTAEMHELRRGFRFWELDPLKAHQSDEIVDGWFARTDPIRAAELSTEVRRLFATQLPDLVGSPLMVMIACRVLGADPDAPRLLGTRTALVGAFVDDLRRSFYTRRAPLAVEQATAAMAPFGPLSQEAITKVVEGLYYRLGLAALDWLRSVTEAVDLGFGGPPPGAAVDLATWRAVCRDLALRSGLVTARGDRLEFVHQAIAEYAASAVCAADPVVGAAVLNEVVATEGTTGIGANLSFLRFMGDRWLREPRFAAMVASRLRRTPEEALEMLASFVGDGVALPDAIRREVPGAVRRTLEGAPDDVQVRAVKARVTIGEPALREDLAAVVCHPGAHPPLRVWALLALGAVGTPDDQGPDYAEFGWPEQKQARLRRLAGSGDAELVGLAEKLAQDRHVGHLDRLEIATALAGVGRAGFENLRKSLLAAVQHALMVAVRRGHPHADLTAIERAFAVTERRDHGTPSASSLTHDVTVAQTVAELGMPTPVVVAALLHPALGAAGCSLGWIGSEFGSDTAELVNRIARLRALKFGTISPETAREAVVAVSGDAPALVVALAARSHATASHQPSTRQESQREAKETLDAWAPLARALRLDEIAGKLEEQAFDALYPRVREEIVRLLTERAPRAEQTLAAVKEQIASHLGRAHIDAVVSGRVKSPYGVFRRMVDQRRDFADLDDLVGVRVITATVRDCYAAMGWVHAQWNPIPGKFKDFIATPTFDLYQALHTVVVGPGGQPVEVQFRTDEMHRRAESSRLPARWRPTRDGATGSERDTTTMDWLRSWGGRSDVDGAASARRAGGPVAVFTPRGDVLLLPTGSTPVDAAYAVHTDIGHRMVGARVNGRRVALGRALEAGDVVEILTAADERANPDPRWVELAASARARRSIRRWFRGRESIV